LVQSPAARRSAYLRRPLARRFCLQESQFVLPSTSGAASGYWDPEPWRELARLVAALRR